MAKTKDGKTGTKFLNYANTIKTKIKFSKCCAAVAKVAVKKHHLII